MNTETAITPSELSRRLAEFPSVTLVDVRRAESFARDPQVIPGALRRLPETVAEWAGELDSWRPVVVYCVHGLEVSRNAAAALRERGLDACFLEGGIEAWRENGGGVTPFTEATRWVTRARPKIDRIACPWLVRRFIDPAAEFFYVPAAEVRAFAGSNRATPYDIADVEYGHREGECTFDAFLRLHGLRHEGLDELARIVRAADTSALSLAPEGAGLVAVSHGLSLLFADDHAMLRAGMTMYDALYLWCRRESQSKERERSAVSA